MQKFIMENRCYVRVLTSKCFPFSLANYMSRVHFLYRCSALMLLMILVIAFAIDHDYPSAQESFVARFMEAAFACGNDTLTFADVKSLDDL